MSVQLLCHAWHQQPNLYACSRNAFEIIFVLLQCPVSTLITGCGSLLLQVQFLIVANIADFSSAWPILTFTRLSLMVWFCGLSPQHKTYQHLCWFLFCCKGRQCRLTVVTLHLVPQEWTSNFAASVQKNMVSSSHCWMSWVRHRPSNSQHVLTCFIIL